MEQAVIARLELAPRSPGAGYDASRFNATRHGILSRYTVLPHEDASEFADLLAALIDEHRPAGSTEAHLVEELAGVIWRKRRVLQAEGARINHALMAVARSTCSVVPAAAPFQLGLTAEGTDLRDLMEIGADEVAKDREQLQEELVTVDSAAALLADGDYEQAVARLSAESQELWVEAVEAGDYLPNPESLAQFLHEQLRPLIARMERRAQYHEAIKAQAAGEGLQPDRLENLSRYETHLDRKFERTLAMLLKLKELRG